MAIPKQYGDIILNVLLPYTQIAYVNVSAKNRAAFDSDRGQYLILSEVWDGTHHIHHCLIHLEIINEKIWVQCDGTEDGIANEMIQAGIPKSEIVLGFQEPAVRLHTGFAIA